MSIIYLVTDECKSCLICLTFCIAASFSELEGVICSFLISIISSSCFSITRFDNTSQPCRSWGLPSGSCTRIAQSSCHGSCRCKASAGVVHKLLQPSITSPERLATRTLRPSSMILIPTRVALPSFGSANARFETWIADSRFTMPAS